MIFHGILMLLVQITDSLRTYSCLNVCIISSSGCLLFSMVPGNLQWSSEQLIMVILRHDFDTFFFTYCEISTFSESTSLYFNSSTFFKPHSNSVSLNIDSIVTHNCGFISQFMVCFEIIDRQAVCYFIIAMTRDVVSFS